MNSALRFHRVVPGKDVKRALRVAVSSQGVARMCVTTASAEAQHEVSGTASRQVRLRGNRPTAPAALQVSVAAEQRILHLLEQHSPRPAGVRVGLRTRGCNGMAYVLNYAHEASQYDEKVAIRDGAHVFIDPRALMHIVGTKMDFVNNDLVSEFVFHNPNAKGTCGCGESFNV